MDSTQDDERLNKLSTAHAEDDSDVVPTQYPIPLLAWAGWLLAGVCLVAIAVLARTDPVRSAREQRLLLSANAPDLVRSKWSVTEDEHLEGRRVQGEVVWSAARQQGFMSFIELPLNDPAVHQYQLWIEDAGRESGVPVDGGVFDITMRGEVTVSMDAKLHVNEAAAFSVTLERPGGVVVSDRVHVLLRAQL